MSLYEQKSRFLTVKFGGIRGQKGIGIPGSPGGGQRVWFQKLATGATQTAGATRAAVDLVGMAPTLTCDGQPLKFHIEGTVHNKSGASSLARSAAISLFEGATLLGAVAVMPGMFNATGADGGLRQIIGDIWVTPTEGVHTFKLQANAKTIADQEIQYWATGSEGFGILPIQMAVTVH